MKILKLRKTLALCTMLLTLFIAECQGSANAFAEKRISAGNLSAGEKRRASEVKSAMNTFGHQPEHSSKKQKKGDTRSKKESDIACMQQEVEIMMKNNEHPMQINTQEMALEKKLATKKTHRIEKQNYNIRRWNSNRLENLGRHRYKLNYNTMCENKYTKKYLIAAVKNELYQTKLRIDIREFSEKTAPLIEKNAMWYFIASRTASISMKYKDLLALKELFSNGENSKYIEMVKSFEGYYPELFDDMEAYMEKNEPLRINVDHPPTVWNKNLGDIYMSECLKIDYRMIDKQDGFYLVEKKYHPLAYAVHMIMMLPEVYQDFSKIDKEFIEDTCISKDTAARKKNCQILLGVHEVVQQYAKKRINECVYSELYSALEDVYDKGELERKRAIDLYRDIYALLGTFYKNAEVVDRRNKYILAGKGIIKNQVNMKCEIVSDTSLQAADKRVLRAEYAFEENRWNISPDVPIHYHVYYVDNTIGLPRRLCMPICVDESGEEHYLHTISDIVEYVKKLYEIKNISNAIYPFRVNKKTRKWTYIKEKERSKTVKDLEEYEVVFYNIEEDVNTTRFTFAEFRPLNSYSEVIIPIPLFLTPLMRSAVDIGLFVELANKHREIESVELEEREPDVYTHNYKYMGPKYSDMYSYYNNLYILPDKIKSTECYAMNCDSSKDNDGNAKAVWCARVPEGMDEYTHCVLNKGFEEKEISKKYAEFIAAVESREHNKNSQLQGFCLKDSRIRSSRTEKQTYKICNWLEDRDIESYSNNTSLNNLEMKISKNEKYVEEIETQMDNLNDSSVQQTEETKRQYAIIQRRRRRIGYKLDSLHEEMRKLLSKRTKSSETELVVFRNVNSSRSNLGAHNEILDVFIKLYRQQCRVQ
ncbi:hypothetical protein NEMIN01_1990 [Nematocida minor]|uniref:uncharacterized protein n=1 Tax=Nematocida minor TaxID=1912983 RepID=UPI00221E3D30|nr:uncharacterized protein NEMIN01_1990 [Nematocida minor]KAI5192376.1 hypothetical protein NEMIN01_1990 [Nematocida minor]